MVNYQVVVGALLLSGSSAQRILSLVAVARTGCRLDGTAGAELDGGFGDVGAGEFLFGFGTGAA
nr:MAG TPA: hypothetical protein [Caudoviricetes sp.]